MQSILNVDKNKQRFKFRLTARRYKGVGINLEWAFFLEGVYVHLFRLLTNADICIQIISTLIIAE